MSTHPSSYPPIYKVHAAATPTHPTHVTLLPPSHCGHSAQDIAMYPSSNTQISHTDRLFAQKNCVQTLGITHAYLSERGILNINSFFKSKSVIEMQVAREKDSLCPHPPQMFRHSMCTNILTNVSLAVICTYLTNTMSALDLLMCFGRGLGGISKSKKQF